MDGKRLRRASPKNGERKSFDRIARELAAIGGRYEAEGKTDSAKRMANRSTAPPSRRWSMGPHRNEK
jgi:hypothetical protein